MGKRSLPQTRRCTKCNQVFPATTEYFYLKQVGKSQLYARCKSCHLAITSANMKAWQKANPERTANTSRRWRMSHIDKCRERDHDKYNRVKEVSPDVYRIRSQTRKARKKNLPDTLSQKEWRFACDYFNGCCAVCGRQLADLFSTHKAAADHWIPLASPECPGTVVSNIVPLCHGYNGCNNSKTTKSAPEWLTARFGARKAKTILQRIETYFEAAKRFFGEYANDGLTAKID